MNAQDTIKALVMEVRGQVEKAETALESALQERENIVSIPIPKQEIKDNFSEAVNTSANRFEGVLKSQVLGRARTRNAIGVKKQGNRA